MEIQVLLRDKCCGEISVAESQVLRRAKCCGESGVAEILER